MACRAEAVGDGQGAENMPVLMGVSSAVISHGGEGPALGPKEGKYSQKVGIKVSNFVFW